MCWSTQGGCSAVHAGWNASPDEAEIPSTFFPLLFLVFKLLCQEKDKSFIMPEVWHKQKYLKGASEHLVQERVLFLQGHGKLSE